jgi:hypothetical protein
LGNSPRNNWLVSEIALIQTVKSDGSIGNSYVVAGQNMELTKTGPNTVSIPTRGGHLLYGKDSMAEIIANTVAAYEGHRPGGRREAKRNVLGQLAHPPAGASAAPRAGWPTL